MSNVQCAVDGCTRSPQTRSYKYNSYLCSKHWREVPIALRRMYRVTGGASEKLWKRCVNAAKKNADRAAS